MERNTHKFYDIKILYEETEQKKEKTEDEVENIHLFIPYNFLAYETNLCLYKISNMNRQETLEWTKERKRRYKQRVSDEPSHEVIENYICQHIWNFHGSN